MAAGRPGTGGCEDQVERLHRLAGVPFHWRQRVRELGTLVRMVDEGLGVSIMPTLGASMLPASLVMVPLVPTMHRELVLSGPRSRPWHPAARLLADDAGRMPDVERLSPTA